MSDPGEPEPYRVQPAHGSFQVVDAAGEVILACSDDANAGQYAALLSQAYRRGYKAGYRTARGKAEDRATAK
jgi:hypothetical protein